MAHLIIPIDGQLEELSDKDRSERNAKGHSSSVRSVTGNVPRDEDLKVAAKVINEGKRIAIMAGQGALGAHEELVQLAELLGAPIIKPLLGKGCVPDDSP